MAISPVFHTGICGFESHYALCGIEQLEAHRPHKSEVVGSSPTPAIMRHSSAVERLPFKQVVAGSNPAVALMAVYRNGYNGAALI